MTAKVFLLILSITLQVTSVHYQSSGNPIDLDNFKVGGFGPTIQVTDESTLDSEHQKYNSFVRNNFPEVNGLKLISYRQQVVDGLKCCMTYDSQPQPTPKRV